MKFAQPQLLNFLWLVPVIAAFLIWAYRQYRQRIFRFVEHKLFHHAVNDFHWPALKTKMFLLLMVFVFSVMALARPQWGFEWQEVKRQGVDLLVVVDVSKSMLTQDVKPNRLERTKLAIRDLVKKLKGDRIGLVAFSGDAFLMCPLTVDYNGFLLSLNDLSTRSVPRGGTNIGRAIEEAMKNYDDTPNQYKAVIIVTDGDDLEGDPVKQALKAKEAGVKIYTIGIGTKEGELIQISNEYGQSDFLKDQNGNYVKSRLNENLLQEISLKTDGAYVKASGAQFGLDLVYEREISKFEKREFESSMQKKYHERFQFPLGIAFILLVMETWTNTRKRKK